MFSRSNKKGHLYYLMGIEIAIRFFFFFLNVVVTQLIYGKKEAGTGEHSTHLITK